MYTVYRLALLVLHVTPLHFMRPLEHRAHDQEMQLRQCSTSQVLEVIQVLCRSEYIQQTNDLKQKEAGSANFQ